MASKKRMIYADAFWNRLQQVVYDIVENDDFGRLQLGYSPDIIEEVLKQIPTVDAVEVVHGRWIDQSFAMNGGVVRFCACSECRHEMTFETNYCPNCGAKMDGG